MNILINGASGFIGYYLTKEMLDAGHTVFAVCRSKGLLDKIEQNGNFKIIKSEQDDLYEYVKNLKIDTWYQLLWDGARGEDRSCPELQMKNELLYIKALRIANYISCPKIIYTGTVYERFTNDIIDKERFSGHSFYILSKKHAHEMTLQLSKSMDIDYIWTQFCHPIGVYMNTQQLMPYAIKCFSENLPTEFGSCKNWFDIISVEYLVYALRCIGEKKASKKQYYIGSGNPLLLKEYIELAAKVCDYHLPIGFGIRPDDGLFFEKEWFNSSDFEKEFGCRYDSEFEKSVRKIRDSILNIQQ